MEVQQTLGHFPGVNEAAVYGVLVPGHDGRAGCAAIHLSADQAASPAFFAALLEYAKEKLPKYAIPVFLRVMREMNPIHNQKQNKIPLKKDGINIDAIYGSGADFSDAQEQGKDLVYWWPSALGHPDPGLDGERYVPLLRSDWNAIMGPQKESARL